MNLQQSILNSSQIFKSVVWPTMGAYLARTAILEDVETRSDSHSRQLDRQAGIDYWVTYDGGMYPVAARVRRGDPVFNDFTIRRYNGGCKSEYFKIKRAMERGALRPVLHIIAYVDDNGIASAAAVNTDLLWSRCDELNPTPMRNGEDGNSFVAVPFTQFTKDEVCVIGDKAPQHLRRDLQPAPFIEETLWR